MIMTKEDKISIQCKYRTNEKIPNHIYMQKLLNQDCRETQGPVGVLTNRNVQWRQSRLRVYLTVNLYYTVPHRSFIKPLVVVVCCRVCKHKIWYFFVIFSSSSYIFSFIYDLYFLCYPKFYLLVLLSYLTDTVSSSRIF